MAPVSTPVVRVGLRYAQLGLAQYVYHLAEDSPEKQRCFEALNRLVRRFPVGPVEEVYLDEHEIGEILAAFGGFLLTLSRWQPPSQQEKVRLFFFEWSSRLSKQM